MLVKKPGRTDQLARDHLLEQVLVNLLTNARDAILESDGYVGRKIIVQGEPVGDHSLEISITDSGGGIPQNNLTRIFAPFFTTREVGKGTESGLSVSFGIIRDMGGNLRAGSSGEGAKFTITLPTVRKSAESRWQLTYLWIK